MNPLIIIVPSLVALTVLLFIIPLSRKWIIKNVKVCGFVAKAVNDALQRQIDMQTMKKFDQDFEKSLIEGILSINIIKAADHSDQQKIVRILTMRINECFIMGTHPRQLVVIFRNLLLVGAPAVRMGRGEKEFLVMLKNSLLHNIEESTITTWSQAFAFQKDARSHLLILKDSCIGEPIALSSLSIVSDNEALLKKEAV